VRQIPPPIMTSELGSFARRTITERKPRIIDRVMATNAYPPAIRSQLTALRRELADGPVAAPLPQHDPDGRWREAWAPWQGLSWLEIPWYLAESYFYHRLLEAVGYHDPGPWRHRDPFAPDKAEALRRAMEAFHPDRRDDRDPAERLRELLLRALWGNQTDLSNHDVREGPATSPAKDGRHLLVDHSESLAGALARREVRSLHVVCDNAGPELLADLILLHHLLSSGLVDHVTLHLKSTPFFVSDAMPSDLAYTLEQLSQSSGAELGALGADLNTLVQSGRLRAMADPFWSGPAGFFHMPAALLASLQQADLVLFKGDANYRRLVDDRHWPTTAALEEITSYLPFSFACLRTLKAELVVGLPTGMAEHTAASDPDWLTSGRWGLIHVVPRADAAHGRVPPASTP
jgi:hypothetical protein